MQQNKRGQAALEFLLTYSWAILVVIVIIGALAYFGVLNPTNFIPQQCTFQAGIGCQDFVYDAGDGTVGNQDDLLVLQLTNGLGNAIEVRDVNIISNSYQDPSTCTTTWDPSGVAATPDGTDPNAYTFQNGDTVEIEVGTITDTDCTLETGLTSGDITVELIYQTAGGIDRDKRLIGDLFVKV